MIVAELTGFTPAWAPAAITEDMSERHSSTRDDPVKHEAALSGWLKNKVPLALITGTDCCRIAGSPQHRHAASLVAFEFNNPDNFTKDSTVRGQPNLSLKI